MATVARTIEPITDGYRLYADSFVRHLRAENASERSVQNYAEAVVW